MQQWLSDTSIQNTKLMELYGEAQNQLTLVDTDKENQQQKIDAQIFYLLKLMKKLTIKLKAAEKGVTIPIEQPWKTTDDKDKHIKLQDKMIKALKE